MASADSALGIDACYPADPPHVADIRRAVRDLAIRCGVDGGTQTRIELAVSEAATNVVLHAYRVAGASGDIHVTATALDGGFLDVVVSDEGVGMSSRPDSPGMGVGLSLIAHEADHLEIGLAADGGTQVFMRFALAADLAQSAV